MKMKMLSSMWMERVTTLLLLIHVPVIVRSQDADFRHELPPGVELVNPKDFGLTDEQLGGLLSNVKVLGGSQIGDTKTQILTVGFNGDEDLNFDDFEIPGLTDKKAASRPDKEKEIANVAFEKFKEFFKDPKKVPQSQSNEPGLTTTPVAVPTHPQYHVSSTTPTSHHNNNNNNHEVNYSQEQKTRTHSKTNHEQQYHQISRFNNQATLQKHYPVTLTQPSTSHPPPTSRSPEPQRVNQGHGNNGQFNHQQRPPQPQHNQQQQHNNFNPNHNYQGQNTIQSQQSHPTPQNSLRLSSHSIAFSNNNDPSHEVFGARLTPPPPPAQPPPTHQTHKQFGSPHQNQVGVSEEKNNFRPHNNNYQTLPPGNFQRFTIYPHRQNYAPSTTPNPPQPPPTSHQSAPPGGKVVRNELIFNPESNSYHQPQYSPHQHQRQQHQQQHQPITQQPEGRDQEYRTITQTHYPQPPPAPTSISTSILNPAPSSSSAIPSLLQRFPEDPQQRPVSHVYIQQGNHATPVQQTSFHPRFQPPTRFAHDFTPTVNQLTTPIPPFDVTPSMPMILISTNENAITDPKRMANLRKQQLEMLEEKRRRQQSEGSVKQQKQKQFKDPERQAHSLPYRSPVTSPPYHNSNPAPQHSNHIPTDVPRPTYHQQPQDQNPFRNAYTMNRYQHQQQQLGANIPSPSHNYNSLDQPQRQNSFSFDAQPQQHQLHSIQQPFYSNYIKNPTLPPRPYYQHHHQQLAQPSTNYNTIEELPTLSLSIRPPPPPTPRFPIRPEPHYLGARHKRGFRHRLSSLFRELMRDTE